MFEEMILKSVKSRDTSGNVITDGAGQCAYGELLDVFAAFDTFFTQRDILPGECSVLRCGNTLPEALLLLWMLYRERHVLLLPRMKSKQRELDDLILPEFCKNKLLVNAGSPGCDIKNPGAYITIEANSNYRENGHMLTGSGNIFLKTSGSTAEPKLVMHSNTGLAGNALNCARELGLESSDRILIPVPIYHMYGLGAGFLPGVLKGAPIDLLANTNVIKYLDHEKQFNPNVCFMTPTLCGMLHKTRKTPRPYRLVVTAGDRLNQTIFAAFEEKFGKLINLYGSTELGVIATSEMNAPLEVRSNGIIKPLPGVEIRYEEDISEIACKHDYGLEAYVDKRGRIINPKQEITWFKTGDLGRGMGKDTFKVIGRRGDSINRNGILVAFSEVESLMEQAIGGLDHVIVLAGDEEDYRGKQLVACCQPETNVKVDHRQIRTRCFDIMMRHMVPDMVVVMEELPRLPNGKFDREKLAGLI